MLAHTLKGVAGNIGATELQTLATELDGWWPSGGPARRPGAQRPPQASTGRGGGRHRVAAVARAGQAAAPAGPSTRLPASRRARSAAARGLLADDDPEAAELLSQHAELFKRQLGPAYRALDAGIRDFDFPAALQALRGAAHHDARPLRRLSGAPGGQARAHDMTGVLMQAPAILTRPAAGRLARTGLLDTPREERFDRLTRMARQLLGPNRRGVAGRQPSANGSNPAMAKAWMPGHFTRCVLLWPHHSAA
jgi:hypothetical protein